MLGYAFGKPVAYFGWLYFFQAYSCFSEINSSKRKARKCILHLHEDINYALNVGYGHLPYIAIPVQPKLSVDRPKLCCTLLPSIIRIVGQSVF